MSEFFSKHETTKKPAIIIKQILALVESGKLLPGDKLPNELEIVRQTDVSRTSVREALSALELMGIITRSPGEGTFLSQNALAGHYTSTSILEKFLEDTENVNGSFEALEARMVLEPSVTIMAAKRAEPEQIEKMEKLLEDSITALKNNDIHLFLDMDREFHIAVAEATNNDVIAQISKDLLRQADVHMWRRYKEDLDLWPKTIEEHRHILDAISAHDTQKARFYAESHLTRCA